MEIGYLCGYCTALCTFLFTEFGLFALWEVSCPFLAQDSYFFFGESFRHLDSGRKSPGVREQHLPCLLLRNKGGTLDV